MNLLLRKLQLWIIMKRKRKNHAIGLSVDENDVDMQSQNSDLSSSDDTEEENGSDADIEYWLNHALEKLNRTSDSSDNEGKCCIFSNKHLGAYLKFLKLRGRLLYCREDTYLNLGKFLSKRNKIHIKWAYFIHFSDAFFHLGAYLKFLKLRGRLLY